MNVFKYMNLPSNTIEKLYYENGLSVKEVGERLGMNVWQVIKYMRKHNLSRRTQADTHRLKFLASPLSFTIKDNLTLKERDLHIAGLMLYWGEGKKLGDDTVDLANSNPFLVRVFLRMLREIYGVEEKRLRVLLYCYANQNMEELLAYWSKLTSIELGQFTKPYVRKNFLEEKKDRMPYGLIHIRYNDKRLLEKIKMDIERIYTGFI